MINEKLFKTVPKNVQSLKYSSCYYLEKADSRKKNAMCSKGQDEQTYTNFENRR